MIPIKTPEEIDIMRHGGKISAGALAEVLKNIKPGIKLSELDKIAETYILAQGATCGFKKVSNYKYATCINVNEGIVHGIPNGYKVKSGDVLKLDFGVSYDGYCADAAWTVPVGEVSPITQKLIETTRNALSLAVKQCKTGKTLGDIGFVIQDYVKKHGFKVVQGLTGHGIGKELHEDPSVYNEGQKGKGLKLAPGMVLAIEPMVSAGSPGIIQLKDDSYATADGSLSAHFEHTVAITEKGPEILTK